jgi:type I restriction enzyme S subunit
MIDSEIQKQQEYKSKLESLKKGLMQKLLTGQIRVKI